MLALSNILDIDKTSAYLALKTSVYFSLFFPFYELKKYFAYWVFNS